MLYKQTLRLEINLVSDDVIYHYTDENRGLKSSWRRPIFMILSNHRRILELHNRSSQAPQTGPQWLPNFLTSLEYPIIKP